MLANKLSHVTPSYTIGISNTVRELQNKGESIVNLSIGEPDFYTPEGANKYAVDAIEKNYTKYDIVAGVTPLREAIVNKLFIDNNVEYSIDEIIVSSGAKHALTNSLMALLNPGDEVIIPKPFWVSYSEMVKLVDAKPVPVQTKFDNDFKLTAEELLQSITERSKVLLINNPSNPTGAIYSREELEVLVDICIEKGIYIIADEIYEALRYTPKFTSVASLGDKAKEITITINGLSKSAAMTGWRIGYTASSKEIAKAISTIQGHLVSHPSTVSQWAALGALNTVDNYLPSRVKDYDNRRNLVMDKLDHIKGIKYIKPEGAFYVFIDISNYKEYFSYDNSYSVEFCNKFLSDQRVAIVPGIAFGNDDYVRIIYCTDIDQVLEGIDRLEQFLNTLG